MPGSSKAASMTSRAVEMNKKENNIDGTKQHKKPQKWSMYLEDIVRVDD